MKTFPAITFLLAALIFSGSALAQLEGQLPPPSSLPPPPPQPPESAPSAPVKVELVIDVYSARRDQHENGERDKAFALWLQQLKKGGAQYAAQNCPKLFHGRMPVEARQQINKQFPDGGNGSVTLQGEAIRLEGERVRVHFSSLGRPGAKPLGDDEKDQQPVSTGLVLQAGQTRVLRLPDAFFGTAPDQTLPPEPTPPADSASARAIENIVVVLRLEKADEERSRYEVPDAGDGAAGPDRSAQEPTHDRQKAFVPSGRRPADVLDGW